MAYHHIRVISDVMPYVFSINKTMLISVDDVIGPEAAPVDGVLVVCLALVVTRVFLGRGIDLHLRLDCVVTRSPFVYLQAIRLSKDAFWCRMYQGPLAIILSHIISNEDASQFT